MNRIYLFTVIIITDAGYNDIQMRILLTGSTRV